MPHAPPSPAVRQALRAEERLHRRWRLHLTRARRDLCLLAEEVRAQSVTEGRLRAACVRLHVHQLSCWVQADSLRALALGGSVSGVAAGGSAGLASGEGGLSAPFDESAHAKAREHHDSCAEVLHTLRSSPRLVALGLQRAGLLREKCAAADLEVASQFLLCSLYATRSHPHDERALLALFEALANGDTSGEDASSAADDAPPSGLFGPAPPRLTNGLLPCLVRSYLRMLPGTAAWLQAAVGKQIVSIAEESERGLRLLTDPMDAYVSLPSDVKLEVDQDVERGEAGKQAVTRESSHASPHTYRVFLRIRSTISLTLATHAHTPSAHALFASPHVRPSRAPVFFFFRSRAWGAHSGGRGPLRPQLRAVPAMRAGSRVHSPLSANGAS